MFNKKKTFSKIDYSNKKLDQFLEEADGDLGNISELWKEKTSGREKLQDMMDAIDTELKHTGEDESFKMWVELYEMMEKMLDSNKIGN